IKKPNHSHKWGALSGWLRSLTFPLCPAPSMRLAINHKTLRIGLTAVGFAAICCIIWKLPKIADWIGERRVTPYILRLQPQLAADPRFKFVQLKGYCSSYAFDPNACLMVSGSVSNAADL